MRKIYNERHMEMEETAKNLDVLRELQKREALNKEMLNELRRLEAKEAGMDIVLNQLEKYAKDHWMYMDNVSMDPYNILNCDLLLMTSTHLYPFEINYYNGLFCFKQGNSTLNKQPLEDHPIQMAQSVTSQIKSNALMHSIALEVKGAAIFPNPQNKVKIYEPIEDIDLITASQLENFIKKMVHEENRHKNVPKINPMHISWFARIDRHHPCWTINIPDELKDKIRPGITCSSCGSFNINIRKHTISCPCGKREALEEAIVRTICDYGLLNNEKDFYPPDLHLFFNNQVSIKRIETCLAKHFSPVR